MAGIIYYSGNRLEQLSRSAARLISENPLSSPLARETILIQTSGMERWFSIEMAKHNSIFGGYEYISPGDITSLAEKLTGLEQKEKTPYSRNLFAWSLMGLMDSNFSLGKEARLLGEYLEEKESRRKNSNELKRFQIASLAADIFDQYALYRENILEYWDQGRLVFTDSPNGHESWQFALWRRMGERYGGLNRHKMLKRIDAALDAGNIKAPEGFPERIICFGISMLPEFYLRLLAKMSAIVPVYLFHLNPSRYYWGDIITDKERARINRSRKTEANEEDSHYERGNALLAGFGTSGRDFLTALYDNNILAQEIELFDDETGKQFSLLQSIQRDIAELQDRARDGIKGRLTDDDDSLSFVSCHSPMREVEVLHDTLLELFDSDATLKPHEILVLSTDVNLYAPYVEAVFGSEQPYSTFIPYSIADRNMSGTSRAVRLYIELLELLSGRLEASKVMSALDSGSIREKFGFELEDMEILSRWVSQANIRWGLDAEFRKELSLPPEQENTWLYGLERMMLGYAMSGGGFYDGLYPFDEIEGGNAKILGGFSAFISALAKYTRAAKERRTLAGWKDFFDGIICDFFDENGADEFSIRYIRSQIKLFDDITEVCEFTGELGFNVMKAHLTGVFTTDFSTKGFITGGITVCSMVPLRSIPFRVIYLLGMNDSAFPRKQRPAAFDLMRLKRERGDRNTRESDRYLFLETILSARDKLYISYIGRNVKDNSRILPSNVVTELLDYIEESYETSDGSLIYERLVREHPLQGFSSKYFDGHLVSYNKDNFNVAKSLRGGQNEQKKSKPSAEIPLYTAQIKTNVDAAELIGFFRNPSKFFLRNCLNIDLEVKSGVLSDMEPFDIDNLDKYRMKEELLKSLDSEVSLAEIYRASGLLPPGTIGEAEFDILNKRVFHFGESLKRFIGGQTARRESYVCRIADISLSGSFDIYGKNFISFRPAKVKPMDVARLWINHLILQASGFGGASIYIGEDATLILNDVQNAVQILENLVKLYIRGHESPVVFFPGSSFAYVSGLLEKNKEHGIKAAVKEWTSGFNGYGERESDPYILRCFGMAALEAMPEFAETACAVFEECLSIVQKEKII